MPASGARSQQCNGDWPPPEIGSRYHQINGGGRAGRKGVWILSLLRRAIRVFREETPKRNRRCSGSGETVPDKVGQTEPWGPSTPGLESWALPVLAV